MITKASVSSLRVWLTPLVLMLLLFAVELFGESARELLRYERSLIAQGEWWRYLTGNFVHLGWYHLALNEMGLVVLVLLCPEHLSPAVWTRRILLISLGMSTGLWFWAPEVRNYVGLSGTIHGLFVLGLMPQVMKKDLIAACCLAYLLGKLGFEMFAGAPVSDEHAIGGSVATASHLWGAVSAFVYGLVFQTFTRTEQWNPWRNRSS